MSRTTQATSTESEETENEEQIVWPEYTPSPAHRSFIDSLRSARIERGLSIADMSDEVGLTFQLANEFENGVTPLPFNYLEVWCETVGVPFADYLAIYWADERAWAEREDVQKEAEQKTPAPAHSNIDRGSGFLNFLRSLAAHIRDRFLSLFSTPEKTSK